MYKSWESALRSTIVIALLSLLCFGCTQNTTSGEQAASGEQVETVKEANPAKAGAPAEVTDVQEGDGEEVEGTGAFLADVKVWEDEFDGTPSGQGEMTMLIVPDVVELPGLLEAAQGMKIGGVRRVSISAQDLFGELPQGANLAPDKRFYIEMKVNEVYPKEEFVVETVTAGKGESVVEDEMNVKVHYVGRLSDFESGEVFDSSKDRNQPFTFTVGKGQVIPGWDKGVLGMKVGEVRRLSIPHYLAYGNQDKEKIPPLSRLFFEVELLEIIEPGDLSKETVKEGQGAPIESGQRGRFHYTGWTDGFEGSQKFDSSLDRQQPIEVTLGAGQVIQGWDQGLVGMKLGEVRRLVIPYNMAYGPQGRPPSIPGFATLYFEVEYLGPPEAPQPEPATEAPQEPDQE